MSWILVILELLMKAIPLFFAAYGMGVASANAGDKLAGSIASLTDMQLNLMIWGGLAIHIIGHASGWTVSGFMGLLKTAGAWISSQWTNAKPAA